MSDAEKKETDDQLPVDPSRRRPWALAEGRAKKKANAMKSVDPHDPGGWTAS